MSNANEFGQGQGTLSQAANKVAAARQDFTGYSKSLTDRLSSLRGQWGGQGASAFFVLQQTWTEKQTTIVNALDEFAESLGHTERINTSTDDDQHSKMKNITSKTDLSFKLG